MGLGLPSCTGLTHSIPGLLLLDFQKAFNTLEWSFIREGLSRYGFGPSIMQWFDTLYPRFTTFSRFLKSLQHPGMVIY